MLLAVLASYPLLVHLSILLGLSSLQGVAIVSFCIGVLYRPLRRGRPGAWLALAGACLLAALLVRWGAALPLLYLPPLLLPLMLLVVFGRTLLPGREALVTAIGEASRGPLGEGMRRYTRTLTWLWCGVFALMAVAAGVLPLLGWLALWSWWTNVVNYVLVGGLFLGEFALRKRRFPEHDHPGFLEYLRIVATVRP